MLAMLLPVSMINATIISMPPSNMSPNLSARSARLCAPTALTSPANQVDGFSGLMLVDVVVTADCGPDAPGQPGGNEPTGVDDIIPDGAPTDLSTSLYAAPKAVGNSPGSPPVAC